MSLVYTISPDINYNNIYKNLVSGVLLIEPLAVYNLKNNWWGTRLGPGGRFSIVREKVIFSEHGNVKLNIKSIPFRYLSCIPWEKRKIDISDF